MMPTMDADKREKLKAAKKKLAKQQRAINAALKGQPVPTPNDTDAYERHKQRARERSAAISRAGQEIGPLPPVKDPARRKRAERTLKLWLETYFADRFPLAWSKDHIEQLKAIEKVLRQGGRQAIGAPRGDGKSTRLEGGIMYGVLTGLHPYAVLLTATGGHAGKLISSIKTALQNNALLLEDYPEVCFPLAKINSASKCRGMLLDGVNLWPPGGDDLWSRKKIVLPTVPGSACSGAVIEAAGLLEATRGLKHARGDEIIRPSVALVDDPQTPKSARSPVQCREREESLASGVAHLGGPARTTSIFAAVTVMRPGDMADNLLRRDLHPEYHGIRRKLLNSWPAGCDPRDPKARNTPEGTETFGLWETYAEIFRNDLANGDAISAASTAFYRRHRAKMDRGAAASWQHRKPGCLSAIEFGMREFFKSPAAMLAEMQNDPLDEHDDQAVVMLTADEIQTRLSGYGQGEIPVNVHRLTWFADVHKELIYYGVCAWEPGFTGYVIDYGTWPPQRGTYFDLRGVRQPISKHPAITATTEEGRIAQALDATLAEIAGRDWKRADGLAMTPELGLIDAGYMDKPVYEACRTAQKKHGLRVLPSHGHSFGPAKKPMGRWDRKTTKGLLGDDWHLPPPNRGRGIRHVLFDAGRRKVFMHRRLSTPPGDPGSLTLFHAPPGRHRMIAEHLTAETGSQAYGEYGWLTIWTLPPNRDNHLLDVICGCCTAESILGGKLDSSVVVAPPKAPPNPDDTPEDAAAAARPSRPKQSGHQASETPRKSRRVFYPTF